MPQPDLARHRRAMLRTLSICLLAAPAAAQFGRRNRQQQQAQADGRPSDIDIAMAGWEQLAKNPGKMAEVMESLKVGLACPMAEKN